MHSLIGRRRANRREQDPQDGYYVDWVDGHYRSLVISVGIFIVVDALATLEILSRGGTEANPLMAGVLGHSMWSFLAIKIGGALVATSVLGIHRHFSRIRYLGILLLAAYGGVVLYHLFLLVQSAV